MYAFDGRAYRRVLNKDKKLKEVMDKIGPCTIELPKKVDLFESLAHSIVYQQLHGKAAASIFARFKELYGTQRRRLRAEEVLRTSEAKLRSVGLSNNKMLSILDLAQKVVSKELPTMKKIESMSDQEIIEKLTIVRGIGPWSVEMFLIFSLGRPDVLSTGDYGLKKGLSVLLKQSDMPTAEQFLAYGERWKPYRSVGCWYLWRTLEL